MNKEHKDPDPINLDAPRLAWYKQKGWKRHEETWRCSIYWVDIKVAQKNGFKFYQTRSNAIILYDTHSQIQKAIMMETGEIICDKVFASPRLPPIFPGTEVAGGAEGSQLTQPKTKHPIVRTERLVKSEQPSISLTREIDKGVIFGCESTNLSTGRLVSGQSIGLFTQREDMNIDFKVAELPHVKLFWNADILTRIGRPTWYCMVDGSQNGQRLVSNDYVVWSLEFVRANANSSAMWETLSNNADWDWFKTLISQEILSAQNPLLEEHCVFGSHTFFPRSWMCEKQTSVPHSSTESEIISLDAGLRLDGIPALNLLDLNVFVFEAQLRTMTERGNPLFAVIRITCKGNLEECSMFWIMLIVFFQTSFLRIRKFCCLCLKARKQWSRWS